MIKNILVIGCLVCMSLLVLIVDTKFDKIDKRLIAYEEQLIEHKAFVNEMQQGYKVISEEAHKETEDVSKALTDLSKEVDNAQLDNEGQTFMLQLHEQYLRDLHRMVTEKETMGI